MTSRLDRSVLRRNRNCGFTLLEVLVALLVLAIGLVGIASLHLNGLRNAHSSYYTTIASSVALDFEERLWVRMTNVAEGCLDRNADIVPIIAALQTSWGAGGSGTISIPGLSINLEEFDTFRLDSVNSQRDFWAEAQIQITWTDERFGGDETFPYTARVVCAPENNS
jgi:prepilin-type N-terminal cleavage/methylation domain-containing protein